MAILKVAQLGNSILRKLAEPLLYEEILSDSTQTLIQNMIYTMREYGGVGLAAPQVHESKQIVVLESDKSIRYPDSIGFPLRIMINPVIDVLSDKKSDSWESCLSLPDFRGIVPRFSAIKVNYFDEKGMERQVLADDFFAIVIQHEVDHLQGKVFIDRMDSLESLSYQSEYQKNLISQ